MLFGFIALGVGVFLTISGIYNLDRQLKGHYPDSEYICTPSNVTYIMSGKYTNTPTYTPLLGSDGRPVQCIYGTETNSAENKEGQ